MNRDGEDKTREKSNLECSNEGVASETVEHQPRKTSEDIKEKNVPENQNPVSYHKPEGENYQQRNYEKRRNYDDRNKRNNYDEGYDNRKKHYESDRRENYQPKKYSQVSAPQEEKVQIPEENIDATYVKRYENKNKVKAWGNPDEAAEIIKKPKEVKIKEEEKSKPEINYQKKKW